VRAIATYTAAQIGTPSAERREKTDRLLAQVREATEPAKPNPGEETAAAMFAGACAACHLGHRRGRDRRLLTPRSLQTRTCSTESPP
jgi:hypothetical protein